MGIACLGVAATAWAEVPLGPLGGKGDPIQDTLFLQVNSLTTTAPGYLAGLRAGDMIYGAFGRPFGTTRSSYYGYSGAVQDFGLAIERAEAGDGQLPLLVLRSGLGGTNITVTLPPAGGFGPAYPLGGGRRVTSPYSIFRPSSPRLPEHPLVAGAFARSAAPPR